MPTDRVSYTPAPFPQIDPQNQGFRRYLLHEFSAISDTLKGLQEQINKIAPPAALHGQPGTLDD